MASVLDDIRHLANFGKTRMATISHTARLLGKGVKEERSPKTDEKASIPFSYQMVTYRKRNFLPVALIWPLAIADSVVIGHKSSFEAQRTMAK